MPVPSPSAPSSPLASPAHLIRPAQTAPCTEPTSSRVRVKQKGEEEKRVSPTIFRRLFFLFESCSPSLPRRVSVRVLFSPSSPGAKFRSRGWRGELEDRTVGGGIEMGSTFFLLLLLTMPSVWPSHHFSHPSHLSTPSLSTSSQPSSGQHPLRNDRGDARRPRGRGRACQDVAVSLYFGGEALVFRE